MPDLTEEQQAFIVVRLACYATPSKVRDMLKLKWPDLAGINLSHICYYNPLSAQGSVELDAQWKDLFQATRAMHKQKLAEVPIADLYYRLSRYQDIVDDELSSQSPKMVMLALKQSAMDIGGKYTQTVDDGDKGDPNAIPQVFEDAVEKIYGTANGGGGSKNTGGPDSIVAQQDAAANA